MCQVSDKIKFCSCANTTNLKHYWVFHSYVGDKGMRMMGMPVMPLMLGADTAALNEKILTKRLNEPDAFDLELNPKYQDRLEIHFTCTANGEEGSVHYGFEFMKGRWISIGYDVFEWQERHEERVSGKIRNGLKRKSQI